MSEPLELKIDCRSIDTGNEEHQRFLRANFDEWIRESIDAMNEYSMGLIWDRNMLYYEGHQTPVGFTNNALLEFVRKNYDKTNPTNIMKKDEQGKIFVVDNRINKWVDGIVGEYTTPERRTIVTKDDDYQNDNIEIAIQKMYDKHETDKQNWTNMIVPSIWKCAKYGSVFLKDVFNRYRNVAYGGEIMSKVIDCGDMLVDPFCREEYYRDSRYRIERQTMHYEQAVEYLAQYGVKRHDISPDGLDRLNHLQTNRFSDVLYDRNKYVNIYFVEYKKTYYDTYTGKDEYKEMGADEVTQETEQGLKEERDYYFYAVYVQSGNVGCVSHSVNKNTFAKQDYDKFLATPMCNKKSDIRPFPISHIEEGANVQDTINIAETMIMNKMIDKSKVRLFILQSMYNKYGDKIIDGQRQKGLLSSFLDEGGAFPIDEKDLKTAINPFEIPDLPKEAYEFFEIVQQNFKQQTDTASALQGDYPKYDMSGKAIQQLEYQKRKKIGYFDININWTNTQRAKKIYNIFVNEYNSEQIIKIMGAKPGTAKALIINGLMTFPEYEKHLVDIGLVDDNAKMMLGLVAPGDPQYYEKRRMILGPAIKEYEKVNEVEYVKPVATAAKSPMAVNPQGSLVLPKDAGEIYTSGVVFINTLSKNDRVDIRVEIDFDKERDEFEDRAIAMNLFGPSINTNPAALELLLSFLGGKFKDDRVEIVKKWTDGNQQAQVMAEIQARGPEFLNAVQALMQNYDQLQAQKVATKPGETQKQPQKQLA